MKMTGKKATLLLGEDEMDLTADVMQIQVEPEYPVQEVHSTETHFTNARSVQALKEVESDELTVAEFLAQIDSLRGMENDSSVSRSDEDSSDIAAAEVKAGQGNQSRSQVKADPGEAAVQVVRPSIPSTLIEGQNFHKVFFAKNSSVLDGMDLEVIEGLNDDVCYRVAGYASPEGDAWYNYKLSLERAETVKETMADRDLTVIAVGALGEFSSDIWPHPWPLERRVEIYSEDCSASQ